LAVELKMARERTGMNTTDAAEHLGTSPTSLNRSETGRRIATVAEVSALMVIYGIKGEERDRIMRLVTGDAPRGWWGIGRRTALLTALINFAAPGSSTPARSSGE